MNKSIDKIKKSDADLNRDKEMKDIWRIYAKKLNEKRIMWDFIRKKKNDMFFFFFSSRRRHTGLRCDWSSDVCSSDLVRNT